MTQPLISLVITTYNRSDLLKKALESVAQSVIEDPNTVEVIIIDNNSTDNTAATVVGIRENNFPFNLRYVLETNQGLSHARNRGLKEAKGKYIVYMDDDQMIEQNYLIRIPEAFKKTQATCVGGPLFYYNAEGIPVWLKPLIENVGQLNLGKDIKIIGVEDEKLRGGNMVFDRSALQMLGGYDVNLGRRGNQLLAGEEMELQDRLHKAGKIIAYCPGLIQYHLLRPERFEKNYWRKHSFDFGRTIFIQRKTIWKNANLLFKAPRTLWWYLLTKDIPNYFNSLLKFNIVEVFQNELYIWSRLGQIYEARNTILNKDIPG